VLGALATLRASLYLEVSIMGIMTAITTTTIVITTKAKSDENNYRSDRPSIDGHIRTNAWQRPGGDGAGLLSTSKRRASVKKRMAGIMAKTRQFALALSKSCGALAYSDPLDA
jgi:hypothetical protein